jgi:hypothetical protein
MLKAHEAHASPIEHELTGIGSTDADHHDDVDIDVLVEEARCLLLRSPGERHHIRSLEHVLEVRAISEGSRTNYVGKVWPFRIHDVVVPIWLEETTMGLKVAMVGGDAIGVIEDCEKIRQQVDQHSGRKLPAKERGEDPFSERSTNDVARLDAE